MTVCHASRDDSGDIDGGILLPSSHDIKAQPLISLGQFYNSGIEQYHPQGAKSLAALQLTLAVAEARISGEPEMSTVSYTCSYTSRTAVRNSDWSTRWSAASLAEGISPAGTSQHLFWGGGEGEVREGTENR
ncbi:hypothetical protein E2C01_018326 [Portunus trituberculatus]|uniref:Uncharacterized protein n=1 Tax=Portunus trituberculatus TaxID=210409 RepID=A0A5B7DU79_PORTR|nr:hypothetical protein [Portunus trituberculatus]